MKLWNFLGEFFLFRWLFGKLQKSRREQDSPLKNAEHLTEEDCKGQTVNDVEDADTIHNPISATDNDLIDDSGDSGDLDDLDIFMRNNTGHSSPSLHQKDSSNRYYSSRSRDDYHDWDVRTRSIF